MTDDLIIIPFDATGEVPHRQRELLDSKARSHISQAYHRRAKWRRDSSTGTRSQQSIYQSADRGTLNTHPLKAVKPRRKAPFKTDPRMSPPPQRSGGMIASPKRTMSWSFGSLGSACSLDDFDAVVIHFFRDMFLGATQGIASPVGAYVLETVQRAVDHPAFLPSLVSAFAFRMARIVTKDGLVTLDQNLMQLSRERHVQALFHLRQSLSNPGHDLDGNSPTQVAVFSGIAHLCMGAIRARDRSAAEIHLKYLYALINRSLQNNMYFFILEGTLMVADLWVALEDDTRPLISDSGPGRKVLQAEVGSCYNQSDLRSLQDQWKAHLSTYYTDCYDGHLQRFFEGNPGAGLCWTVTETELILPPLLDTINTYRKNYLTLGRLDWPHPEHHLYRLGDITCLVLFKLSAKYSDIKDLDEHVVGAGNDRDSEFERVLHSELMLIALQIHWMAGMKMVVLRTTFPILSRRIRKIIKRLAIREINTLDLRDAKQVLKHQFYLWVYITGMLGAGNPKLDEYEWFRARAVRTARALQISTSASIHRLLGPFSMYRDELNRTFNFLADSLFEVHDPCNTEATAPPFPPMKVDK